MHGLVVVKNYQQIFLIRRINKQDSTKILKLCGRFYHEKYNSNICEVLVGHAGPWQIFFFKNRWAQCYLIEAQVGLFYLLFFKLPVRSINVCFQFSVKFLDSSYSHHPGQMGHRYPSNLLFCLWAEALEYARSTTDITCSFSMQ